MTLRQRLPTTDLLVKTDPAQVRVFVRGGRTLGMTSQDGTLKTAHEIGDYVMVFSKTGYEDLEKPVSLVQGMRSVVDVSLPRLMANLTVTSEPSGIRFQLEPGGHSGVTPKPFKQLPVGDYIVTLTPDGGEPIIERMHVGAYRDKVYKRILVADGDIKRPDRRPLTAMLKVEGLKGAKLTVGAEGKEVKEIDKGVFEIFTDSRQPVTVTATRLGYQEQRFSRTVVPDMTETVRLGPWQPASAALVLHTSQSDRIRIDDGPWGPADERMDLKLGSGTFRLQAVRNGYPLYVEDINIPDGADVSHTVDWTKFVATLKVEGVEGGQLTVTAKDKEVTPIGQNAFQMITDAPQTVTVTATRPGYQELRTSRTAVPGKTELVRLGRWQGVSAVLVVQTNQSDRIRIDDGPWQAVRREMRFEDKSGDVKVFRLQAERSGYPSYSEDIRVEPGTEASHTVNWKRFVATLKVEGVQDGQLTVESGGQKISPKAESVFEIITGSPRSVTVTATRPGFQQQSISRTVVPGNTDLVRLVPLE